MATGITSKTMRLSRGDLNSAAIIRNRIKIASIKLIPTVRRASDN